MGIAKCPEPKPGSRSPGETARMRFFFTTSSGRQTFGETVSPCRGELAFTSVLPVGCPVLFAVPGWKINL
jgi:hypothetical protein